MIHQLPIKNAEVLCGLDRRLGVVHRQGTIDQKDAVGGSQCQHPQTI